MTDFLPTSICTVQADLVKANQWSFHPINSMLYSHALVLSILSNCENLIRVYCLLILASV
jgi:hypothetical protein